MRTWSSLRKTSGKKWAWEIAEYTPPTRFTAAAKGRTIAHGVDENIRRAGKQLEETRKALLSLPENCMEEENYEKP